MVTDGAIHIDQAPKFPTEAMKRVTGSALMDRLV